MGAWGTGYFENDDAMDWLNDLSSNPGWQIVSAAFEEVESTKGDYLEAPEGSAAVAAAAVLAGKFLSVTPAGPTSLGLPEAAIKVVDNLPAPSGGLATLAKSALAAVDAENSELFELWQEADPSDFKAWRASIRRLREILPARR